ncbi:hypothetical protein ACWCPS_36105 [Streptomyces mauvecolor]
MFEYIDTHGDRLTVRPTASIDGTATPVLSFTAHEVKVEASASVFVPLDRLEEVFAGMRDTALQHATLGHRERGMTELPRRFHLLRHHDVSGISGTGVVALDVRWPDGTASVRRLGEQPSVVLWDRGGIADAEHVHAGATEFVWLDQGAARRVLTPGEHDRAWHAVEGAAGEPGADPGTVLDSVLAALGIDAPTKGASHD